MDLVTGSFLICSKVVKPFAISGLPRNYAARDGRREGAKHCAAEHSLLCLPDHKVVIAADST